MERALTALVTNDDGIDSPGLHRLAQAALDAGLELLIAAPASEASGSSASITVAQEDGRILYERRELAGLDGVTAFAVEAGPGLITLLAGHGTFGPTPDLVLSGINRGINVGQVVLHSGTVGAALTGGVNGLRALAVSQEAPTESEELDWTAASALARQVIPRLAEQPRGTVLNLNVPIVAGDTVPELRAATLAEFGVAQTTATERDEGSDDHVRLAVSSPSARPRPGSDAALLADGYATLTAIRSITEDPAVPLEDLVSRSRG
ncbi:5'/3'-nucleotidase SurE [Brachybacterium sp. GCM10030267]|uniref:5'/3'-nucleotidase SurE n=1 Tax=Brachybacterium sp. GCM10030267 TaxID=3273381 RepID=UPI00361D5601